MDKPWTILRILHGGAPEAVERLNSFARRERELLEANNLYLERARRAEASLSRTGAVKVKALEWVDAQRKALPYGALVPYWRAQTAFDWGYRITSAGRAFRLDYTNYDTLEAAKASAQADYERRIRSALTTAPASPNDEHRCPVCDEPFKVGEQCASDIELGMCHAECLEGSPTVDLDTGEPVDGPIPTYPYEPATPEQKPLNMPTDPEWYQRKAGQEGDHDIAAGRLRSTINLTPEELAEYERIALEALPKWAQDEIRAARAAAPEGRQEAVARAEPFSLDEIKQRILGALDDYRDSAPEDGETWEGWYYASFDLASAKIGDLLDRIDTRPAEHAVTEAQAEAAARIITKWLGYAWDGLHDGRVTEKGFPVFIHHSQTGWKFQGHKGDMIDLARAALKAAMEAGHG